MFSKNNPEKQVNNPQVQDLIIKNNPESMTPELPNEQQSILKLVEKISSILSPYFIVIVGLYLYDNNFLFGSILILVGILSLLKISYEDIWEWIDKIKNLFSENNKLG
ncbi:hypothetical protein [Geminocystis sp. NIES-3709]|uniref:hypothetical protein n=1 Tax=Geminocystis sp. NIES-3709 TaxID=1617448 RepID=UPI0005FC3F36|nr:hypothetical protein [Geminocystis sp. NIES-3709]BAQ64261.1 hypothetical protein GM3709_1026 [Geminocystis sp. NIES-3709]